MWISVQGSGGQTMWIRIFTNSAPLGRVSHRVAMSVCLSVCLRHWVQFFFKASHWPSDHMTRSRPLIIFFYFHQIGPLGRFDLAVK